MQFAQCNDLYLFSISSFQKIDKTNCETYSSQYILAIFRIVTFLIFMQRSSVSTVGNV